ncbi:Phosphoglycerate mutase [Limosilactobacillus equigenerosi DSM 18793 = JCM 14505]|uniref:Phosphoglycerate mutase n=2 Tax=Limosilactobacillus TaxID=2742598 RepID=A0A0R1US94_9LACO|nr:Phosphoglycerate mutase [Limosilactobacillus equigenerosi DSM 18793 = JCM 14505]
MREQGTMTKLYLIRHGKTEWNLAGRYQGANGNSPLLPQSHQDIVRLASYLAGHQFAAAYTSPLLRAKETATELVAALDTTIPLVVEPGLREVNLGQLEGMYFTDAEKRWPRLIDDFHHHADRYNASLINGESFEAVIERMKAAFANIAQAHPNEAVLVVSHGAALNAGINGALGSDLVHLKDRGGLSNTSTTILETLDGGQTFTLLDWNNTAYLDRESDPTDTI